jgi:hypothetical protein
MDMSEKMWILLGVLFVFPLLLIALLNWIFRKRGGIGKGWGGALIVTLCWVVALAVILSKTTI